MRRIVITALLLFYALFPDSRADAQTGADNVLDYWLCLFACTLVNLLRRRIREGAGAERPSGLCLAFISIVLLSSLRRREMVYIFVLVSALLAFYAIRRRSRVTGAIPASGILLSA